ncbi:hypothetical protein [Mycolicibacterium hodleri]|uniref:Uncharacterized protein n=1 Tax=Mycolicibacterium hodleri TaxID=49897 RepID=A0A502EE25_9MYCO|nr:hypothetical protein [Mycolicibacterium hodleri]TPG35928.1 hypothetical protein EAH80_07855 [Mycolicibacterium hodleri]
MAAVEVIYLLAAILWIGVVLSALCLGLRFMLKWRAKRRRINRMLGLVNLPVRLTTLPVSGSRSGIRWNVNQLLSIGFAEAFGASREKVARRSRRPDRRPRRGF